MTQKTSSSHLLCAAAAACIATSSLTARAQVDDADGAADAIYAEAKRLYAEKDFIRACPKFAAVHTIDPGIGSALYLGDCYEKQGKTASARAAFADAIALAKARKDDRLKIAQVRFAAADALVGKLRVEVPAQLPDNTRIDVGEKVFLPDELDEALPLDEGPHVVIMRAPGHLPEKVAKEVRDGATSTVKLSPLLVDPDAAWQITPLQVGGLVTAGAGVIGVIVGSVFGARAISTRNEYRTHCNGQPDNLCRASAGPLFDDAKQQATVSTATLIAGGALLGLGVTLFVVGNEAPRSSADETALRLSVGPGSLGIGGTF